MEVAKHQAQTAQVKTPTAKADVKGNYFTTITSENIGNLQRAVISPQNATPETVLQLQRIYGNKAVSHLIQRSTQTNANSHVCNAACNHKNAVQRSTIQRHAGHSHNEEENALQRLVDNPVNRQFGTINSRGTLYSRQSAFANAAHSSSIQRSFASRGVIQRHASFEHKMLGDVDPNDLKILASAKNLQGDGKTLKDEDEAKGYKVGENTDNEETFELKIGKGENKDKPITRADVLHIIDQEIRRLNYFKAQTFGLQRQDKRTNSRKDYEKALKNIDKQGMKFGDDNFDAELQKKEAVQPNVVEEDNEQVPQQNEPQNNEEQAIQPNNEEQPPQNNEEAPKEQESNEWQVRLVELASKDVQGVQVAPLLVTYGEMNTLADIYGSPQELLNADPINRYKIIQGIRNQALVKYLQLRDQVAGTKKSGDTSQDFQHAIGNTGRLNEASVSFGYLSGAVLSPEQQGETNLMGETGEGKKADKKEDNYTAGLARNACHFAPESWFNWRDYHTKARTLAKEAYDKRQEGDAAAADKLENDALIQNGFGDHFLQDSYASGHLINKTQIMQWFVPWLDKQPFLRTHTTPEDWEAAQQMSNEQDGLGIAKKQGGGLEDDRYDISKINDHAAKDPQAVENMEGEWTDRFEALGLKVPDSLKPGSPQFDFLLKWQKFAAENKNPPMPATKFVEKKIGGDVNSVLDVITVLKKDGVVKEDTNGFWPFSKETVFSLRSEYVPKNKDTFSQQVTNIKSTNDDNQQNKQSAEEQYDESAKRTTFNKYHKFLNNAVIQASTNQLHDYFCKNGLEVITGTGDNIGKIYGDYTMLEKDSAKGVQYSGETAKMSREAIYNLAEHGNEDGVPTVEAIAQRFPTQARGKNGAFARLDKWHEELKTLCEETVFAQSKWSSKDLASTVKSHKLTEKVSQDQHGDGSEF